LGFLGKATATARHRLLEVSELMNLAAIPTTIRADILSAAWNKLIVNVGINALTAMENCTNGELLCRPKALAVLEAAVLEAARVARACGIEISSDPVAMTIDVCRKTGDNISSMVQDLRHGRHTEVEAINGAILRQAQALGISVPANQSLLAGVKALEDKGRCPKPE
jgi:2-dehydropantoate 2-reductase